jgi:hypothetical protein
MYFFTLIMHTNYDFKSIKNSIKVAPNQKGKGDRLCCPKPNFNQTSNLVVFCLNL